MASINKTAAGTQPFYYSWRVAFWGVILLSFALYVPSLGNSPVWDDTQILSGEAIGGNTFMGALTQPFLHGYFRPLVSLALYAENLLFQGSTFFYHIVNVILHSGGCAALMALVLACCGRRKSAVLAGLGMAVHPALVSTVAWIGGITDTLSTLLVLLFLWTLVLALRGQPKERQRLASISVVCYLAALFCKEQVIALLPLVPLAALSFPEPGASRLRPVKALMPYLAATFVFLVLWNLYFPGYHPAPLSISERLLMIGQSLLHYALVMVFPLPKLLQTYTLGDYESGGWVMAIAGYVLLGTGLLLIAKGWRCRPAYAFFGALGILYILPVANILSAPSLVVAPYRASMAAVAFCALLGLVMGANMENRLASFGAGAYAVLLAAFAWLALPAWSDNRTLFATISEADPNFILARRNYARELMMSPPEATSDKAEAVRVLEGALTDLYGSQYWQRPDKVKALVDSDPGIQRRIRSNKGPMAPEVWLSELFTQLGEARAQKGYIEGSRAAFTSALVIRPTNFTATMALAQLADQSGDVRSARAWLQAAQKLKPGDPNIGLMIQALPPVR